MDSNTLFVEIIKAGIANPEDVIRDLGALLRMLRADDDSQATKLVTDVEQSLFSDTDGLELFNKIKEASQKSDIKFGPALAGTPGVTQRLALFADIAFIKLNSTEYRKVAIDFVEQSSTNILELFAIAQQVYSYFGNTIVGRGWQRAVIPSLLQKSLQDSSTLLTLTGYASGNDLPEGWHKAKTWIDIWVSFLASKSPQTNDSSDGFFKPYSERKEYQPAAIHPLVLPTVQEVFLNEFKKGKPQDEAQQFSTWLVESVFDRANLIPGVQPECAFAAGAFILGIAEQQSINIQPDGQVIGSPENSFWVDLSTKVLEKIVINSEQSNDTLATWKDQQARIREIIDISPSWKSFNILSNLRLKAKNRLLEGFNEFTQTVSEQDKKIPVDHFLPDSEVYAVSRLPELRPSKPIDEDVIERQKYNKQLELIAGKIDSLEQSSGEVRSLWKNIQASKRALNSRLASPFAESALPEIVQQPIPNPALANYLRQQNSKLTLEYQPDQNLNFLWQSPESQSDWASLINESKSDLLQQWVKLEAWDSLRGRFLQIEERDRIPTSRLYDKCINLDFLRTDLNQLRQQLAALAHLGIPIDDSRFTEFIEKLESALKSNGLDPSRKALLCAARLEFGLTAMSMATTSPEKAFGELFSNLKSDSKLVNWVSTTLESANIWEARAGMNMLILLARLAEATGDLYVAVAVHNIVSSSTTAKTLVANTVKRLLTVSALPNACGLPLAFAAFDLTRYTRESAQAIALKQSYEPLWLQGLPDAFKLIEQLTEHFGLSGRTGLQSFAAEGGLAAKNLLLAIFQIKLDELQREQHLTVQPLRRSTTQGRHNVVFQQLENLKKTLRSVFCSEQVLLNEYWSQENSEGQLWWQTQYWSMLSVMEGEIPKVKKQDTSPFNVGLTNELDREIVPEEIRQNLRLSNEATAQVQSWEQNPDNTYKGVSWLIIDRKNDGDETKLSLDSTYFLQREESGTSGIFLYTINPPFYLFNWSTSYHSNINTSLLSLAATLESAVPIVSEQTNQDIDGRFEGEFSDLSWREAINRFNQAVEKLKQAEKKYEAILKDQNDGNRTNEVINLLKQPLFLNTVDYKEQITAAIADIRQAEAELEAAENESLANNFEVFAHEFLYEAAKLEVERQSALEDISKLEVEVSELDKKIKELNQKQVTNEHEIIERDVEIAIRTREQAEIRTNQAQRARAAILQEIELLRNLLETETTIPGTSKTAKGKIGVMAYQVEEKLIKQLEKDLETAKAELKKAEHKERKRKKKEKRRKLVNGICRFIGAVVGSYFGGSYGASLGAEIGGAVAEIANGIVDNKPPEEILVGLIDNSFAITKAAGIDLEKELNTLVTKNASQVNEFFNNLDSSLKPMLDSMPKIFDEKLITEAIKILDFEEIPELKQLIEESYADLKKDISNLDKLGSALKDAQTHQPIIFESGEQLLNQLGNNLFEKTKDNEKRIEALGKAIGERIERLRSDVKLQKDTASKIAKLLVAQIGQESIKSRPDTINFWIRSQRNKKKFWNNKVVQDEANALIKELFTDREVQTEVLANIESSLLDPSILRGRIQEKLGPWQKELDKHLNEITEVDGNASPPSTAVDAARASVQYLENCIQKFNQQLLPFLKGDNDPERGKLLKQLDEALQADLNAIDNLKIADLDVEKAKLSQENAKVALENMKLELEKAGKLYNIADLKVNQAAIQAKVAKLSKLQAEKHVGEKENLLKAAQARQKAAESRVKGAKFNVESRKALAEGATKRGAEASRIRVLLSQPPLRLLENSLARETAAARFQHAEALVDTFKAYRELVRYFVAADVPSSNIPLLKRPDPLNTQLKSWSSSLEEWHKHIGEKFTSPSVPSPATAEFEWELTPQQIASLLSPDGFRLTIMPDIQVEPVLFSVGLELQEYLGSGQQGDSVEIGSSPWQREFRKNGIFLSSNAIATVEDSNLNWKITTDSEIPEVEVTFRSEGSSSLINWRIKAESISFSVKKQSGLARLIVTRRIRSSKEGRSVFSDRYYKPVTKKQATTGRIAGIFISGKIRGTSNNLDDSYYDIYAIHLGDIWITNKQLQIRRIRELPEHRDFFVSDNTDLRNRLAQERDFFENQGDPDPFMRQGIPLSGTTLIRLIPIDHREFERLKLRVLFSFFS